MKFYTYSSQFKENNYPIYVISNENPTEQNEWNEKSYEKKLIGCFTSYKEAMESILKIEPNFIDWEELDDSYIQGETVFVHK